MTYLSQSSLRIYLLGDWLDEDFGTLKDYSVRKVECRAFEKDHMITLSGT